MSSSSTTRVSSSQVSFYNLLDKIKGLVGDNYLDCVKEILSKNLEEISNIDRLNVQLNKDKKSVLDFEIDDENINKMHREWSAESLDELNKFLED